MKPITTMNKEEEIIRSYVEIDDINQSELIEILPLTISDMLIEYAQQKSIQSLIDRNYNATKKRGQITTETTRYEFVEKIYEEIWELDDELYDPMEILEPDMGNVSKELADIILVCFSMAKHFGINWQQVMQDKVEYNEKRED